MADQTYIATPAIYAASQSTATGGLDITTAINENVRILNLTAPFTGGNVANVLKYRISYHLVEALT